MIIYQKKEEVKQKMRLLLVEDDLRECNIYKRIERENKQIEFVAITDSAKEGINLYRKHKPEGIILDLELTKGSGTGFDFIEELNNIRVKSRPKIIVTTNICSESVYEFLHKNNVDFIFYKKQKDYSQEKVINTMLLLKDYVNNLIKDINTEIEEEPEDIIKNKINEELDLIGISPHMQGRKYLYDAIYYIIESKDVEQDSILRHLRKKHQRTISTINRGMQNAIIRAWRISPLEDLTTYYTARINYETGIPTPTEFIYYYADKIKKQI